jgi:hypothetical protein
MLLNKLNLIGLFISVYTFRFICVVAITIDIIIIISIKIATQI